jgi:hypothetical protein
MDIAPPEVRPSKRITLLACSPVPGRIICFRDRLMILRVADGSMRIEQAAAPPSKRPRVTTICVDSSGSHCSVGGTLFHLDQLDEQGLDIGGAESLVFGASEVAFTIRRGSKENRLAMFHTDGSEVGERSFVRVIDRRTKVRDLRAFAPHPIDPQRILVAHGDEVLDLSLGLESP